MKKYLPEIPLLWGAVKYNLENYELVTKFVIQP